MTGFVLCADLKNLIFLKFNTQIIYCHDKIVKRNQDRTKPAESIRR
jgi:hypothetical protein